MKIENILQKIIVSCLDALARRTGRDWTVIEDGYTTYTITKALPVETDPDYRDYISNLDRAKRSKGTGYPDFQIRPVAEKDMIDLSCFRDL